MASLKLGIRTRITGGFGLLVAISLGLTGFAYWQFSGIDDQVTRMSRLSDLNTRAAEIGDSFEAVRFALLRCRAFGDEAALQQAAEAEAKAAKQLEAARQTTALESRRQAYENLLSALDGLRAQREIVAGYATKMH